MKTQINKAYFDEHGYVVVQGLFSQTEAQAFIDHYMYLRKQRAYEGDFSGVNIQSADPLKQYPRMIHMHRWDEVSLRWLIDNRINQCLTTLTCREPYAVQTMLYFKPPGARGQALHQDNFYLRTKPGTCIAAWMALDACDEANGCMLVVPGSHRWQLLCTIKADTAVSFTDVTVPLPPNAEIRAVNMQPGDVLFFNGALVHGSYPNSTADRFRRALIGHYIEGNAEQVAQFYHPALRMDGTPLDLEISEAGGVCGVWVEKDGSHQIELSGIEGVIRKHE
jgi:ectoine hydroxylase-related dioxygenase (phytanoyl-CoA dioxygenase family)